MSRSPRRSPRPPSEPPPAPVAAPALPAAADIIPATAPRPANTASLAVRPERHRATVSQWQRPDLPRVDATGLACRVPSAERAERKDSP